jgi:Na+-transporting NADH:ubiquinone oxidoreductase subunit NqrF
MNVYAGIGSALARHSSGTGNKSSSNEVTVHWINKDKSVSTTKATVGSTLLSAAHANDIEIEGACEGKSILSNRRGFDVNRVDATGTAMQVSALAPLAM